MDFCFKAYPAGSAKRWKDPDNKCRTVTEFVRNLDGPEDEPWKWAKKNHRRNDRGLCMVTVGEDPEQNCRLSWLNSDKSNSKASRGYTSILRPYYA